MAFCVVSLMPILVDDSCQQYWCEIEININYQGISGTIQIWSHPLNVSQ